MQSRKKHQWHKTRFLACALVCIPLINYAKPTVSLPAPHKTHTVGTVMSMHDAVLLALRNSPDITTAELDRVTDKYALIEARYAYLPHFTLGGSFEADTGTQATATVDPITAEVKNSPIGVTGTLGYNPVDGSMNISLSKDLWRGNSYTNYMGSWWTAEEKADMARYAYRDSIITVIHNTTQAFRALASAKLTLLNDQASLDNDLEQLKDAKLKLKLGRGTTYDVNQSKLDVANDKSTIIDDQQAIRTARVKLNETLGLDPSVPIRISDTIPLPIVKMGPLAKAIQKALHTSTDYRQATINLKEAQRALVIAKNNMKPSLTYNFKGQLGGTNPTSRAQNTISWGIPIDNVPGKSALISARINLLESQQKLITSKNNVISTVTLDYNNLKKEVRAWGLAKQTLSLNEETVNQQTALYQAGQLNLYELSQAKQTLTTNRNNLQTTKDGLWDALESYRTDIGTVLSSWHITLN